MHIGGALNSTFLSTIIGSLASGVISSIVSLFGRHAVNRKNVLSKDSAQRQQLYSQFIKEVEKIYIKSLDGEVKKPSLLVPIYSLIGQMALVSSENVVKAAEKVLEEIIDAWQHPAMTIEEIRKIRETQRSVPIREFTEACRTENNLLKVECLDSKSSNS